MEVEFGLKFSVSGGVILAAVAGEASLKVTLSYETVSRHAVAGAQAPEVPEESPGPPGPGSAAGAS